MSTTNDQLQRNLGEIDARLETFETIQKTQSDQLDELIKWKNQLAGARKAFLIAISAAAGVGGAMSWVLNNVTWK